MNLLITLLIFLLVLVLVFVILKFILGMMGVSAELANIIYLIFGIIALLLLISMFMGYGPSIRIG